jgi:branched-chain amino acid transport system permease protein
MKNENVGLLSLAAVLLALPLILPNGYFYDVAIRVALNACIAIGLNLLVGYTGQISLGHAGFVGIGAYSSAILASRFGWPSIAAVLASAAAAGALALLVARPILRLKGHYLAMATLGLGVIVSIVIVNESRWTGGPDGMPVDGLSLFGHGLAGERSWYWAVCALLLGVTKAALNLVDSPAGRALQAVHGSEVASRSAGIDGASIKVRVFALSAVLASLVGSLNAHYTGFVTPAVAGFQHSIELITMVVVGGMASIFGSIVGAALLTMLPQVLSSFDGWESVAYGVILMLTMIALPRGLVPTLRLGLMRGRA